MTLTETEVNEKYADVPVTFYLYWKYEFSYKGVAPDGNKLKVSYGGDSDNIYRYDVGDNPVPFEACDRWTRVVVVSPEGETLFKYTEN